MTPSERFRILTRDGFRCRYCGARAPDAELQVDHIHPRSRGGRDNDDNLVTACRRCNVGKSAILLPQLPEPPLLEIGEKIAKLLRDYANALEEESDWRRFELVDEIRCMGAVVNEFGGYTVMKQMEHWLAERVGWDNAEHLEWAWNDIGEWAA
jgi:HNH endonuclease